MADSSNSSQPVLTALYNSSANVPFKYMQSLPPLSPTMTTEERVAYLSQLRKGVVEMQSVINKELTNRMEEDKARDSANGGEGKKIDEEKEEINYGEEIVEED